jgi:hypothetical protein
MRKLRPSGELVVHGDPIIYWVQHVNKSQRGWVAGGRVIGLDKGLVVVRHGAGVIRIPPEFVRKDLDLWVPDNAIPEAKMKLQIGKWSDPELGNDMVITESGPRMIEDVRDEEEEKKFSIDRMENSEEPVTTSDTLENKTSEEEPLQVTKPKRKRKTQMELLNEEAKMFLSHGKSANLSTSCDTREARGGGEVVSVDEIG